uniref:Uncharacterized protein n=1 Tax=Meloidogyne incognita TaxID=6306 RepID=A0A914NME4_MELIC
MFATSSAIAKQPEPLVAGEYAAIHSAVATAFARLRLAEFSAKKIHKLSKLRPNISYLTLKVEKQRCFSKDGVLNKTGLEHRTLE